MNTFCSLQRSYSARPRMSTAECATLRMHERSRRSIRASELCASEDARQSPVYHSDGYPQNLTDLYAHLSTASRARPANLPLQVVTGHDPCSSRSPAARREVRVHTGSLVNALYKCGHWLNVRTAENKVGFIPLHCAQPISSSPRHTSCHVPQIRAASCRQRQLPPAARNNRLNHSLSGSDCSRSDCDESGEVVTDPTEILSTDSAFSETHSFLSAPDQPLHHNLSDDDTQVLEMEEEVMVDVGGQRGTPRKRCAVYLSPDKDLSVLFSRTLVGDDDLDMDSSFLTPTPHSTYPSPTTSSTLKPSNEVHGVTNHQVDYSGVSSTNTSLYNQSSHHDTSFLSINDQIIKGRNSDTCNTFSYCHKRSPNNMFHKTQSIHPSICGSSHIAKKSRTQIPSSYKRLTVLFSYRAVNPEDVTVTAHDVVTLLDDRAGDWLWVRTHRGNKGYIPKSCTVDLEALNLDPRTKTTYL